jgi:hypothetical protein
LVALGTFEPLYQLRMMDDDECGAVGGMIGRINGHTRSKWPSATLSTTKPKPILLDMGSNQGLHSGKLTTNRLSYDTVLYGK